MEAETLVLAIGHSARDTYEMLLKNDVSMKPKAFAVGFRVEHPQEMIDDSQYSHVKDEHLPPAPYKLTFQATNGRSVYSFCMCPGGFVVNASSEEGRIAVNGMSYSKRDGSNANSAIIISVTPDDFEGDDALCGVRFQRKIEEETYRIGGGKIPQQLYKDYKAGRVSSAYGEFESATKGQRTFGDVSSLFSGDMKEAFIEAMEYFGTRISGFDREDAILSAIESRTSAPVRINRDESFQSNIRGMYPCGEGAGYAGGITSAAMDGLKVAEAIING